MPGGQPEAVLAEGLLEVRLSRRKLGGPEAGALWPQCVH
jgi:hypothetical protein